VRQSVDASPPATPAIPASGCAPADTLTVMAPARSTALPMPTPQVVEARAEPYVIEAEAARRSGAALFFGGGCYEQKVLPLGWGLGGRLCASAGGRHIVVWDMGTPGSVPPLRLNGRATLLGGHSSSVTWLAFRPPLGRNDSAEPERGSPAEGATLLASVSADGRVLLHRLSVAAAADGAGPEAERPRESMTASAKAKAIAARGRARNVWTPTAATGARISARDTPAVWVPGGRLIFCTRDLRLACVSSTLLGEEPAVELA
jgi:hypothetical protein